MKLANGEMRPGTILEVVDNHGTIKAEVPGLFNRKDVDKLPPITPCNFGSSNSFSTPNVGDEVWVLFFTDNPEELMWFRKDNFSKNNGKKNAGGVKSGGGPIQEQQNVEVLSSRRSGTGWATIYFSDGTGWIIQNQSAVIKIDKDGKIQLSTGQAHSTVEVSDNGISLGTAGGSSHPACHGDKVAELFDKVMGTFQAISQAAKGSPYTMAIATAIDMDTIKYKNDSQYINSDYVTLD